MIAPKVFTSSHDGKEFAVLVDEKEQLLASSFSSRRESVGKHVARLADNPTILQRNHPLIMEMVRLYNGDKLSQKVGINMDHVSSFRKQVYRILESIPRGKVTSYGLISKALDSGPRAVGTAVASNPFCLFVPCHRVVPFDLTVGNYSMNGTPDAKGCSEKRSLLENEGVEFAGDAIVESCLWKPRA